RFHTDQRRIVKTGLVVRAARLEHRLSLAHRQHLATNPRAAVRDMGIWVVELDVAATSDACSVDGAYFPQPYCSQPVIGFVRTPRSRRENFTLLHELGHHLVRL